MSNKAADRIIAGLKDALRFVNGDTTGARVHRVKVAKEKAAKPVKDDGA